jgi:tyrocidine synthetase III
MHRNPPWSMVPVDICDPSCVNHARHLAYVMYTSGSTGQPKGVMVEHRNVVRLVKNTDYIQFKKSDRLLQTGAPVFDATTFEIWGALLNGLTLYLVDEETLLSAPKLGRFIKAHAITLMWLTSPLFNQLAEASPAIFMPLRCLITGGDVLSPKHINTVRKQCPGLQIINGYGPTENTTFSTCHPIAKKHAFNIPIGRPIRHSTAYTLDKNMDLMPIGFIGELCVGGDGLARGYLNRPALTAEKFVPNPFNPGERLYKTGDLARWRPDGNLEFIGRVDNQVKIRGFRIELAEVEAGLLRHTDIKDALVLARADNQHNKYLCAYIVAHRPLAAHELRLFLARWLPEYMVPAIILQIEKFPLNRNGKIDVHKLPQPERAPAGPTPYVAPRNNIEAQLARIWKQILDLETIGIHDNFFELGGHSLKAAAMMSMLNKAFNVSISLKDIFDAPVIQKLAERVQQAVKKAYPAIRRVPKAPHYPVSANQKRIFILNRFAPDTIEYNVPMAMRIEGALDTQRLAHAFAELVAGNESLRTSFDIVDERIVQIVHDRVCFAVKQEKAVEKTRIQSILKRFVRPFDLGAAPLIRVTLIQSGPRAHVLLMDMHHIICDGISVEIMLKQIAALYQKKPPRVPEIQYKDYADWQNHYLQTQRMQQQEAYWKGVLEAELPVLDMFTDFPRPAVTSPEGDRIVVHADKSCVAGLKQLCMQSGTTLYMVLLAAYTLLLSKYSGQEDIIVGTPVSGRYHESVRDVIGIFINTLAMRNRPQGHLTFLAFLDQVRANALNAYEHQEYQFEELVDKIHIRRDTSRSPIFDTMFTVLNFDIQQMRIGALKFTELEMEYPISKYDLTLTAIEKGDSLAFDLEYRTRLYKKSTIESIARHFLNILERIVADPAARLSDIEPVGDQEKHEIIYRFNDTDHDYPKHKTIHALFEEQAARTPERTAIRCHAATLCYGELNARANQLARRLQALGAGDKAFVGLMMQRSIEMVIGLLGILKAGAAYVPIDSAYPAERIRYLLTDSGVGILLTRGRQNRASGFTGHTIDLEDRDLFQGDDTNLMPVNTSDDLAYIIYTSGSTGRPKGVMVTHRGLVNYIVWARKVYAEGARNDFPLYSSISFDLTVTSIFTPLIGGDRVVVYDATDPAALLGQIMAEDDVDIIKLTPTHLKLLEKMDCAPKRLRTMIVGGEDLKTASARRIHERFHGAVAIYNEYGPTETVVGCMLYKYDPRTDVRICVPIGKPADNVRIYLLDRYLNPVPPGVAGELFIAGDGVAKGYLNQPELTRERFIANPFEHLSAPTLYRTGDRARFLLDGNIEFLGRTDNQVKIRGFRVETGEIEVNLLQYPHIKEALVTVHGHAAEDRYLCAYIVADREIRASDVRRHLTGRLPAYMIPADVIQIDQMPLNQNGKIDVKQLPRPHGRPQRATPCVAPRNRIEEQLAAIWKRLLRLENISVDDDFFEVGGHSLKATLLMATVNKTFNTNLSLGDIFNRPTIHALAQRIAQSGSKTHAAIEAVEPRPCYPVSTSQKRIYILNQLAPEAIEYNVPIAMGMDGDLDANRFEHALQALIERHESLRTAFEMVDQQLVQKIHDNAHFALDYIRCGSQADVAGSIKAFIRPFDLSRAPLLRVRLIEVGTSRHILLMDMHHIITDGISVKILFNDLARLYAGETLAAPAIQYKDYAVWQAEYFKTDAMKTQEAFWTDVLKGELPVLNLLTDFARTAVQSLEGDRVVFKADKALTQRLKALCTASGATLYMVLLSAYTLLLSKYSGQEDILVGTPIAGRYHETIQDVVGMFVNTLVMRNQPLAHLTYTAFLAQVRRNALSAYENQEYPFEELVEKVSTTRDLSRNPIFDTMFASIDLDVKDLQMEGLALQELEMEYNISKFDLTLMVSEDAHSGQIHCELEYRTRLFRKSTIERMGRHFLRILTQIADNPNQTIGRIETVDETEKHQLLQQFNDTRCAFPETQTITQLFEAQVARTPSAVAIVDGDAHVTYQVLNAKANQLARRLRNSGLRCEQIAAIQVQPSIAMLIGILAILKAGGAYLPIAANTPAQRVDYMLEDSGAAVLLSDAPAPLRPAGRTAPIYLDLNDERNYQGADSNLEPANAPRHLAYVIYTSGTTGHPKAVMVEHAALVNLCTWHNRCFGVTAQDRSTKYADFGFDASVWEIFPYLVAGAALHILDEATRLDPVKLNAYFEANRITISFLPTPVCEQFMDLDNRCLRILLTGGDKLRRYKPRRYKLVNNYGPTENTVVTTWYPVDADCRNIPIGRPIANTRVYILGAHDALQPIGVPGELCIAGVGLARGYLNRAEQNARKFVRNPHHPDETIYRSGDWARWLPDGNIEFLARIDNQVKLRGYRIEPGEIEAVLIQHPNIREALVLAKQDNENSSYLCAYIRGDQPVSLSDVRHYLAGKLPDYMIPAYVIQVADMPLNQNGKIDLKALPEPDGNLSLGSVYVASQNRIEGKLVKIWREALGLQKIGIDDNFFEIGGHSLKATIMISKVNKAFSVDIALSALFNGPTIRKLAEHIKNAVQKSYPAILAAQAKPYYHLTPTQRLLYAICLSQKGIEYNLPMAIDIQGPLDPKRLAHVFDQLIDRHESLRTSFAIVNRIPMQQIHHSVTFSLDFRQVADRREIETIFSQFIQPFDLSKAPLMRGKLLKIGAAQHILLIDMHHLITDGASMGILFREIASFYKDETLAAPKVKFKDFTEWLHGYLKTEQVKRQHAYWMEQVYTGDLPVLELDTDFKRPDRFSFEGDRILFKIDRARADALKQIAVANDCTLFMVLLAAYTLLLSKYSRQEDIIVGMPLASRYHADIQDVVGMFVSTHAIRNKPSGHLTFNAYLEQVRINALNAFENQECQLWDILGHLLQKTHGKPLFNTVFIVQNIELSEIEIEGLAFREMELAYNISKFDLTLCAVEKAQGIDFELEFSTKLFKKSTARRIARHYVYILKQIIADQNRQLKDFSAATQPEIDHIRRAFSHLNDLPGWRATVQERFEEQVRKTPDHIALVCGQRQFTYHRVNQRANQLARLLRSRGVGPQSVVGIMLRPSLAMVVATLAVLKAGGAFLPISRRYPARRVVYMLHDSKAMLLLSDSDGAEPYGAPCVVNLLEESNYQGDGANLENQNAAHHLAYVIYTPGSTGRPKGVMIEHRSVVNLCNWHQQRFGISGAERGTQYADFGTDASVWEIFPCLLGGATLHILEDNIRRSLSMLKSYLEANAITLCYLPAPVCEQFQTLGGCASLRWLLTGGDKVRCLGKNTYELVNIYGPSESCGVTTSRSVTGDAHPIPGDRPIANTAVYILGPNDEIQPVGVTGEIHIAGIGLARGYLRDAELTALKFRPNPFQAGQRLFRTGDLARWLPDGTIEFRGRTDLQVHLNGHRIELGEIEATLLTHPAVRAAAVCFKPDHVQGKQLIAFLVLDPREDAHDGFVPALTGHLRQWMPDFMVPQVFIGVGRLPTTSSGEIDRAALQRAALPLPDYSARQGAVAVPQTATQQWIVRTAETLLGRHGISVKDNIASMGCDSMRLLQLILAIDETFGVGRCVHEILQSPVLGDIADQIDLLRQARCLPTIP